MSPQRNVEVIKPRHCQCKRRSKIWKPVDNPDAGSPRHRASYTLEGGIWWATCRICGFTAKDAVRSRAASWFLAHIREMRLKNRETDVALVERAASVQWAAGSVIETLAGREPEIDLRDHVAPRAQ